MTTFWYSIGQVTHTLQDSFAPAHVRRVNESGHLTDMCTIHWYEVGSCWHPESKINSGDDMDDHPEARWAAKYATMVYLYNVVDAWVADDPSIATDGPLAQLNQSIQCSYFTNDHDADGFPAGVDCDDENKYMSDCQGDCVTDTDSDGIPDGCDHCPYIYNSFYVAYGGPFMFEGGEDSDGNGFPDVCELCPGSSAAVMTGFVDVDSDGVHDGCDSCLSPGQSNTSFNPVQACDPVNPSCPSIGPEQNRCIPSSSWVKFGRCNGEFGSCAYCPDAWANDTPSTWKLCAWSRVCDCVQSGDWGRCARQANEDGDLQGDTCDECPTTHSLDYRNSNTYAEQQVQGLERLADVCEAVPIVRIDAQETHSTSSFPLSNSFFWYKEQFQAASWLGHEHNTASSNTLSFSEHAAFRHCSCYSASNGSTLSLDECAGAGNQCNSLEMPTGGVWRTPTIGFRVGNALLPVNQVKGAVFKFETAKAGAPSLLEWAWRDDAAQAKIVSMGGSDDLRTHGVIGAFVFDDQQSTYASTRDSSIHGLRATVAMYSTPNVKYVPPPPPMDLSSPCAGPGCIPDYAPCLGAGCFVWVDPREFLKDPWVTNPDYLGDVSRAGLLSVEDGVPTLRGVESAFSLEGRVSEPLKAVLQDHEGWRWLSPVESTSILRSRGKSASLIGLPTANTSGRPVEMVIRNGVAALSRERPTGGTMPELAQASAAAPMRFTDGERAVYSGIENAVMVAGVPFGPGARIVRYDVSSGRLSTVSPHARLQPSQDVLATTYDPIRRELFVLDKVPRVVGGALNYRARLTAFDLSRTNEVRQLFEIPYVGKPDAVDMVPSGDGRLVLIVAREHSYQAWLVDPRADTLAWVGVRAGNGTVLDGPVPGNRAPLLPLVFAGRLSFEALDPSAFHPGKGCSEI